MLSNLYLYDILQLGFDELPDCIDAAKPFTPCGAYDAYRIGWVPPLSGAEELLSYSGLGHTLLQARIQTKKVPAAAVRSEVTKWVKGCREKGKNPSKEERKQYKESVVDELLPNVIPTDRDVKVWIDAKNNTLALDTPAASIAEAVLKLLRESLGSLSVTPFGRDMPSSDLTEWLRTEALAPFYLHDSCTLAGKSGEKYTAAKADIHNGAMLRLLDDGAVVTKLGLVYEDEIEFTLTDAFNLRGIKFTDVFAAAKEEEIGESESLLEHDIGVFLFTVGILRELLTKLREVTL